MPAKQESTNAKRGTTDRKTDTAPDDFPDELNGEFSELSEQLVRNIGTIAGLAVSGGGYFGVSVTDDGGSCRLAIRSGPFVLDKRFSTIAKFEGALAYCLRKLQ